MKGISISYFKSPIGEMVIGAFNNEICLCDWRYRKMRGHIDNRIQSALGADFVINDEDKIILLAKKQLSEYFSSNRKTFDLPLNLIGTPFQKEVWQTLTTIEYGSVISYAQLANQLKQPLAIRAIASANGANALALLIPCHRVIGSDGQLVGYAGGLQAKRALLLLENAFIQPSDAQMQFDF